MITQIWAYFGRGNVQWVALPTRCSDSRSFCGLSCRASLFLLFAKCVTVVAYPIWKKLLLSSLPPCYSPPNFLWQWHQTQISTLEFSLTSRSYVTWLLGLFSQQFQKLHPEHCPFPPASLHCSRILHLTIHLLAWVSQSKKNTFFLISQVQSSQLLSGLLILTSNVNVCTYVSRYAVSICCLEHCWPLFHVVLLQSILPCSQVGFLKQI